MTSSRRRRGSDNQNVYLEGMQGQQLAAASNPHDGLRKEARSGARVAMQRYSSPGAYTLRRCYQSLMSARTPWTWRWNASPQD
eukprot:5597136-Lingulodinium_polyedra.AAC.1